MSHQSHDNPVVDRHCTSYGPGHRVHFIHARKSWENGDSVDVLASVRRGGMIRLESHDDVLECWHQDTRRLAAALRRTGGFARWSSRWHALAVPIEPGRNSLFNLADPAAVEGCDGAVSRGVTSPRGPVRGR